MLYISSWSSVSSWFSSCLVVMSGIMIIRTIPKIASILDILCAHYCEHTWTIYNVPILEWKKPLARYGLHSLSRSLSPPRQETCGLRPGTTSMAWWFLTQRNPMWTWQTRWWRKWVLALWESMLNRCVYSREHVQMSGMSSHCPFVGRFPISQPDRSFSICGLTYNYIIQKDIEGN